MEKWSLKNVHYYLIDNGNFEIKIKQLVINGILLVYWFKLIKARLIKT